jgi:hypothetical protein
MIKYDISAYADYTTSWGEPCYVGVLSIKESEEGKWVKADAVDVFVDDQVSEVRKQMTLEHIKETAEMRKNLNDMNLTIGALNENLAKDEHYHGTVIADQSKQIETLKTELKELRKNAEWVEFQ